MEVEIYTVCVLQVAPDEARVLPASAEGEGAASVFPGARHV